MKIENQIDSLETQLTSIEGANLNLETMKAMKQGAQAMKQIHGEYDVDKVENTMDDIREQVELADEISEAISRPVGTEFVDEDELDEELAMLQEEEKEHKQQNSCPKGPCRQGVGPRRRNARLPYRQQEQACGFHRRRRGRGSFEGITSRNGSLILLAHIHTNWSYFCFIPLQYRVRGEEKG